MKKIKDFLNTTYGQIIISIFIFALCVKIIYAVKTPYNVNQHDIEPNGNGLEYIMIIFTYHKLPSSNIGQFYHPPFNQFLCATWIKVFSFFIKDNLTLYESLQFLTTIYSIIMLFATYNIGKQLKLNKKYIILLLLIMGFFPYITILSGSINNDLLCLLMMVLSLLYLIKWYKSENINDLTVLAIFTGLSVMTKASGALIAFPISYIFILKAYRVITKNKKNVNKQVHAFKKYFWSYLYFGCISLPIGLWYNFRNLIKFDQPILYVFDTHNPLLYTGEHSIIERFLSINWFELKTLFCHPFEDFNIPTYLLKCSLFAEYTFINNVPLYIISILSNLAYGLLIIISIISIIHNLRKNKRYIEWKIVSLIIFFTNWISYIKMNISLPYGCSMDFRYLELTILADILLITFFLDSKRNKKYLYKLSLGIISILILTSNFIILAMSHNGPL